MRLVHHEAGQGAARVARYHELDSEMRCVKRVAQYKNLHQAKKDEPNELPNFWSPVLHALECGQRSYYQGETSDDIDPRGPKTECSVVDTRSRNFAVPSLADWRTLKC